MIKKVKDTLKRIEPFSGRNHKLYKSIYIELKIWDSQIEPLPTLASEVDFEEIMLSQKLLKTFFC